LKIQNSKFKTESSMLEPVREYFVKDGVVMQTRQFDPAWSKGRKTSYEVMRVIDGAPLFAEEHVSRLIQSAMKAGLKEIIDPEKIKDSIGKLIHANTREDGNILFCLIPDKEKVYVLSWYVEHHYPLEEDYRSGVFVRTMKAIRKQPNAKIWNAELRSKAQYLISSSDAYEVLLVDKKKNITEGSKSNIFFIRGNSVFTTPEADVLQGITRQKVLQLCSDSLIKVSEQEIALQELAFYEAAFITGTSPGILPVSMIEKHRFNTSNEIMKKLMAAYNTLVGEAAISIR